MNKLIPETIDKLQHLFTSRFNHVFKQAYIMHTICI